LKKPLKRILAAVGILLAAVILLSIILFRNELATLGSLKKADPHPLYAMAYAGDYGFSNFLKTGASSDRDIERFVIRRLLKGVDIDLGISSAGCSAFTAQTPDGQRIYARNFDFDFAPALILKTAASDGYASISTVNLAFAGYGENKVPSPLLPSSLLTLAAPYLPFDGMNEKGVVIALLAVPRAEPPQNTGHIMLNTTTMIRLVLDHAATVEEAIALIRAHDLYFSGDVECHYLISDAAGDSAVVEFLDQDVKITKPDKNYQAATNFIMYQGLNEGEGYTEFERYDTIDQKLTEADGVITESDAMKLLSDVVIPDRTQWSVVYNQATGAVTVCMGANYDKTYTYQLDMAD
jgi:hypothetical protein